MKRLNVFRHFVKGHGAQEGMGEMSRDEVFTDIKLGLDQRLMLHATFYGDQNQEDDNFHKRGSIIVTDKPAILRNIIGIRPRLVQRDVAWLAIPIIEDATSGYVVSQYDNVLVTAGYSFVVSISPGETESNGKLGTPAGSSVAAITLTRVERMHEHVPLLEDVVFSKGNVTFEDAVAVAGQRYATRQRGDANTNPAIHGYYILKIHQFADKNIENVHNPFSHFSLTIQKTANAQRSNDRSDQRDHEDAVQVKSVAPVIRMASIDVFRDVLSATKGLHTTPFVAKYVQECFDREEFRKFYSPRDYSTIITNPFLRKDFVQGNEYIRYLEVVYSIFPRESPLFNAMAGIDGRGTVNIPVAYIGRTCNDDDYCAGNDMLFLQQSTRPIELYQLAEAAVQFFTSWHDQIRNSDHSNQDFQLNSWTTVNEILEKIDSLFKASPIGTAIDIFTDQCRRINISSSKNMIHAIKFYMMYLSSVGDSSPVLPVAWNDNESPEKLRKRFLEIKNRLAELESLADVDEVPDNWDDAVEDDHEKSDLEYEMRTIQASLARFGSSNRPIARDLLPERRIATYATGDRLGEEELIERLAIAYFQTYAIPQYGRLFSAVDDDFDPTKAQPRPTFATMSDTRYRYDLACREVLRALTICKSQTETISVSVALIGPGVLPLEQSAETLKRFKDEMFNKLHVMRIGNFPTEDEAAMKGACFSCNITFVENSCDAMRAVAAFGIVTRGNRRIFVVPKGSDPTDAGRPLIKQSKYDSRTDPRMIPSWDPTYQNVLKAAAEICRKAADARYVFNSGENLIRARERGFQNPGRARRLNDEECGAIAGAGRFESICENFIANTEDVADITVDNIGNVRTRIRTTHRHLLPELGSHHVFLRQQELQEIVGEYLKAREILRADFYARKNAVHNNITRHVTQDEIKAVHWAGEVQKRVNKIMNEMNNGHIDTMNDPRINMRSFFMETLRSKEMHSDYLGVVERADSRRAEARDATRSDKVLTSAGMEIHKSRRFKSFFRQKNYSDFSPVSRNVENRQRSMDEYRSLVNRIGNDPNAKMTYAELVKMTEYEKHTEHDDLKEHLNMVRGRNYDPTTITNIQSELYSILTRILGAHPMAKEAIPEIIQYLLRVKGAAIRDFDAQKAYGIMCRTAIQIIHTSKFMAQQQLDNPVFWDVAFWNHLADDPSGFEKFAVDAQLPFASEIGEIPWGKNRQLSNGSFKIHESLMAASEVFQIAMNNVAPGRVAFDDIGENAEEEMSNEDFALEKTSLRKLGIVGIRERILRDFARSGKCAEKDRMQTFVDNCMTYLAKTEAWEKLKRLLVKNQLLKITEKAAESLIFNEKQRMDLQARTRHVLEEYQLADKEFTDKLAVEHESASHDMKRSYTICLVAKFYRHIFGLQQNDEQTLGDYLPTYQDFRGDQAEKNMLTDQGGIYRLARKTKRSTVTKSDSMEFPPRPDTEQGVILSCFYHMKMSCDPSFCQSAKYGFKYGWNFKEERYEGDGVSNLKVVRETNGETVIRYESTVYYNSSQTQNFDSKLLVLVPYTPEQLEIIMLTSQRIFAQLGKQKYRHGWEISRSRYMCPEVRRPAMPLVPYTEDELDKLHPETSSAARTLRKFGSDAAFMAKTASQGNAIRLSSDPDSEARRRENFYLVNRMQNNSDPQGQREATEQFEIKVEDAFRLAASSSPGKAVRAGEFLHRDKMALDATKVRLDTAQRLLAVESPEYDRLFDDCAQKKDARDTILNDNRILGRRERTEEKTVEYERIDGLYRLANKRLDEKFYEIEEYKATIDRETVELERCMAEVADSEKTYEKFKELYRLSVGDPNGPAKARHDQLRNQIREEKFAEAKMLGESMRQNERFVQQSSEAIVTYRENTQRYNPADYFEGYERIYEYNFDGIGFIVGGMEILGPKRHTGGNHPHRWFLLQLLEFAVRGENFEVLHGIDTMVLEWHTLRKRLVAEAGRKFAMIGTVPRPLEELIRGETTIRDSIIDKPGTIDTIVENLPGQISGAIAATMLLLDQNIIIPTLDTHAIANQFHGTDIDEPRGRTERRNRRENNLSAREMGIIIDERDDDRRSQTSGSAIELKSATEDSSVARTPTRSGPRGSELVRIEKIRFENERGTLPRYQHNSGPLLAAFRTFITI